MAEQDITEAKNSRYTYVFSTENKRYPSTPGLARTHCHAMWLACVPPPLSACLFLGCPLVLWLAHTCPCHRWWWRNYGCGRWGSDGRPSMPWCSLVRGTHWTRKKGCFIWLCHDVTNIAYEKVDDSSYQHDHTNVCHNSLVTLSLNGINNDNILTNY